MLSDYVESTLDLELVAIGAPLRYMCVTGYILKHSNNKLPVYGPKTYRFTDPQHEDVYLVGENTVLCAPPLTHDIRKDHVQFTSISQGTSCG